MQTRRNHEATIKAQPRMHGAHSDTREGRDRVVACRRLDVTVDVTLTVLTHSLRG